MSKMSMFYLLLFLLLEPLPIKGYGLSPLTNLYYPVAYSSRFPSAVSSKPVKIEFFNQTFVAFKKPKKHSKLEMYCDVCPHQGASLSEGRIDSLGRLRCPYHGIPFSNGTIENGPCFIKDRREEQLTKIWLKSIPHLEFGGMIWAKKGGGKQNKDQNIYPHLPKEHFDQKYRYIEGVTDIPQYQDVVNENLLDMLHISFVHSFGNRLTPIPVDLKYEELGVLGGRTSFMYSPNVNTISTRMGGVDTVIVENEFHLPSVTVTRVQAGSIVKTVWTSSIPLKGKKTRLFWRVYRNFWRDPYFPVMDKVGDWFVRQLMIVTIEEDKWILNHVYENQRDGPLRLKYDITIAKYRKALSNYKQL